MMRFCTVVVPVRKSLQCSTWNIPLIYSVLAPGNFHFNASVLLQRPFNQTFIWFRCVKQGEHHKHKLLMSGDGQPKTKIQSIVYFSNAELIMFIFKFEILCMKGVWQLVDKTNRFMIFSMKSGVAALTRWVKSAAAAWLPPPRPRPRWSRLPLPRWWLPLPRPLCSPLWLSLSFPPRPPLLQPPPLPRITLPSIKVVVWEQSDTFAGGTV